MAKQLDRYPLDSNYSLTRHIVDTLDGNGPVMSSEREVHYRIRDSFGQFAAPEARGPEGKADPRTGPRMSFKGEATKTLYLPYDVFGRIQTRADVGGGTFTTVAPVFPEYTTGLISHSAVFKAGSTVWEGCTGQVELVGTSAIPQPNFATGAGTQQTLASSTLVAYSETVTVSATATLAVGMLVSAASRAISRQAPLFSRLLTVRRWYYRSPRFNPALFSLTFWVVADGVSQLVTSAPVFLAGTVGANSMILNPLRLGFRFGVSNNLLIQSPRIFVPVLREQISRGISSVLDNLALFGTGLNGQPLGVFAATGSPTKLSSSMTWPNFQTYRTTILQQDLDPDSFGGVLSPSFLSYADQTQAYTGASYSIWEKMLDSHPERFHVGNEISTTTLMTTGAGMFLGLWRFLYILLWADGIEVQFDKYSMADYNETVVRATVLCNVGVPFPAAFASIWQ
jgi:hypothetical protein